MNSIERVLGALTHGAAPYGPPDRVPVLPVPLMQGALVHDLSPRAYFERSAADIARAQIELNHMLDGIPDAVAGFPHVVEDVTAFGVKLVAHYENSSPTIGGLRIDAPSDIDGLRVPSPTDSPQLVKTLETIRILAREVGREKVVIGAAIAPFSLPSMLMGTAGWMRLLYTPSLRDRWFRKLMQICESWVVAWANAQFQAGAHVVVLADGMASATMIPRAMFDQWAFPVIRRTIGRLNGLVGYEAVGRAEPFVDALAESGAAALLIGEEDSIIACKRAARQRVGLIGNVNNMKMRRWSAARVELECRSALQQGRDGYGFALANQGPELPFDVGLDRVVAMCQSVERYGRYDHGHPVTTRAA